MMNINSNIYATDAYKLCMYLSEHKNFDICSNCFMYTPTNEKYGKTQYEGSIHDKNNRSFCKAIIHNDNRVEFVILSYF